MIVRSPDSRSLSPITNKRKKNTVWKSKLFLFYTSLHHHYSWDWWLMQTVRWKLFSFNIAAPELWFIETLGLQKWPCNSFKKQMSLLIIYKLQLHCKCKPCKWMNFTTKKKKNTKSFAKNEELDWGDWIAYCLKPLTTGNDCSGQVI